MTGSEMKELRRRFKMNRIEFARLIGYTGTDRNDETRVKRHENSRLIPLYLARLLHLVERWKLQHDALPEFPNWPGYDEFDHTPDPGHKEAAHG